MKRITKMASALLCGTIALSMTGCFGGSKISPAKLYSYAKSDGAVVFDDYDELLDATEDEEIGDAVREDGVAIMLSVDDLMDAIEEKGADLNSFRQFTDNNMDEVTIYAKNISSSNQLLGIAAYFEDEDDAEDFYDEYTAQIKAYDLYDDAQIDYGTEKGIEYSYVVASQYGYTIGMGVYLDGNYVLMLMQYSSSDVEELLDMCDSLGLPMAEEED